jgi:hypothetical protein
MQQPIAMIRALDVSIHLRAQKAAGEWMIGIAGDADGTTGFDRDEHGASVRAIVGTCSAHRVSVARSGGQGRSHRVLSLKR